MSAHRIGQIRKSSRRCPPPLTENINAGIEGLEGNLHGNLNIGRELETLVPFIMET
jgi:hypothetical protein